MQSIPLSVGAEKLSDTTTDSNSRRNSSSSEYIIKVRKPYTVSKQRERWTSQEHDKFLEALKLYGRAWRKLEEHIGTKTAVQIRSHAQKFLAKVARETRVYNPYESKAVEIPPPRPKKRPLCPYPRKLENMPNIRTEVKENMPPTSVICTDTFSASASSHVSCVNQSELFKKVLNDDGCLSSITSVEVESMSDSQCKYDMDVDLITGDSTAGKEASSLEGSTSNLKLFGKTLVTSEPCKPQYTNEESETNNRVYMWPNNTAPFFYMLPSPQGIFPMWGGLYCHLNLHPTQAQMVMSSEEGESALHAKNLDNSAPNFELSINGKNMNTDTSPNACKFRQSETSAFRRLKTSPKKMEARGFMPYNSCILAERQVSHKTLNGEVEVQM